MKVTGTCAPKSLMHLNPKNLFLGVYSTFPLLCYYKICMVWGQKACSWNRQLQTFQTFAICKKRKQDFLWHLLLKTIKESSSSLFFSSRSNLYQVSRRLFACHGTHRTATPTMAIHLAMTLFILHCYGNDHNKLIWCSCGQHMSSHLSTALQFIISRTMVL